MEIRKNIFGIWVLLFFAALLISGCTQNEKTVEIADKETKQENASAETNQTQTNDSVQELIIENKTSESIEMQKNETMKETPKETVNESIEEPVKETIEDIRAKAKYVCPHRYEGVSVNSAVGIFAQSPETTNIKIWVDGKYKKEEITKNGEIIETEITHPDAFYTRYSSTGDYIKIANRYYKNKTSDKITSCNSTAVKKVSILDENIKTEMIDGKLAAIYEFSSVWGDDPSTNKYESGSYARKEWFWVENGLVLREETVQSNDGSTISTRKTDYKNFVFEQIPKSMFEDPEYDIYMLN